MSQSNSRRERRRNKKILYKLLEKIRKYVLETYENTGHNKWFVSVDVNTQNDYALIRYEGAENLNKNLGFNECIVVGEVELYNQLLLYTEVYEEGKVFITDGIIEFRK